MTAHAQVPSLLGRAGAASALTLAAVGGALLAPGSAGKAYASPPPGPDSSQIRSDTAGAGVSGIEQQISGTDPFSDTDDESSLSGSGGGRPPESLPGMPGIRPDGAPPSAEPDEGGAPQQQSHPPRKEPSKPDRSDQGGQGGKQAAHRPEAPKAEKPAKARQPQQLGTRALNVAHSKRGAPYRYGATGPGSFDCSGLTVYAYKSVGKSLPRTASAQYNSTRRIPASSRRPGDLVFFGAGRGVYHVGIYAGDGKVVHSPKAGSVVRVDPIWSNDVAYGRVD